MTEMKLNIEKDDENQRIDKVLSKHFPTISRSRFKALIEEGKIIRNDQRIADPSYLVKNSEEYTITIDDPKESGMKPAPHISLDIIYEDDDLMVINKPAGLTVHPGIGNHHDTMVNALLAHKGDSLSVIGGEERPGIVHRLDRDTSGLLIVAKNDFSHKLLAEQIASREVVRIYDAVVFGVPKEIDGLIEANMDRARADRTKMQVVRTGGKEAITEYTVKKVFGEGLFSLIACKLKTGRTHQIRVHMSHLGHSLIGDQKYGNNDRKLARIKDKEVLATLQQFKRQALHSTKLGFFHPKTSKYLEFEAKMPEDMRQLILALEKL